MRRVLPPHERVLGTQSLIDCSKIMIYLKYNNPKLFYRMLKLNIKYDIKK